MSFFISDAWAEAAPAAAPTGGDPLGAMLPFIILFVVFYFLLIRPQSKRAKEHRAMVEALKKGDEVLSAGGVLGKITEVGDNFVKVEIADGIEVKMERVSISKVLPKGTSKEL